MHSSSYKNEPSSRLLSLDFLRGLIMVLLALESTGLYEHLEEVFEHTALETAVRQFFHHPWNGLRMWDIVQPAFMFMAGTAMAYSLSRQQKNGMSWQQSFTKTLKRCGWLFFWGVLIYAVRPKGLSFELWNVLTQLSFTTLITFLIFRWPAAAQIAFCAGLLLLTEGLYRFTNVPDFDQPFTDQHNFGNYIDLLLMNKINRGGWVAINCIPTAVHTIAGALAGKLLLKKDNEIRKMLTWALICLVVGYGLDWLSITPIIKRIATSSFTLASLGWCLLSLAAAYWWIDVKRHKHKLKFFTVVGMNAIFIYLFFEIVASGWFNQYVSRIVHGILIVTNFQETGKAIIASICIFILEWYLCYFLYRKKIFFKL